MDSFESCMIVNDVTLPSDMESHRTNVPQEDQAEVKSDSFYVSIFVDPENGDKIPFKLLKFQDRLSDDC